LADENAFAACRKRRPRSHDAMLEDVSDLTRARLNEATQAWVEYEYNRKIHSEIGEAPVARFLKGPEVTRPSPDSAALRLALKIGM
jgi:putative transposase